MWKVPCGLSLGGSTLGRRGGLPSYVKGKNCLQRFRNCRVGRWRDGKGKRHRKDHREQGLECLSCVCYTLTIFLKRNISGLSVNVKNQ
jgi:hypothetical protein